MTYFFFQNVWNWWYTTFYDYLMKDVRIHAWMKSSIISRLDDSLVEGGVFQIENFSVRRYGENERNQCFTGDKRIFFTESTVVMPCIQPHEFIPQHVFDCIPLNTVRQHSTQDTYLIGKKFCQHIVTISSRLSGCKTLSTIKAL